MAKKIVPEKKFEIRRIDFVTSKGNKGQVSNSERSCLDVMSDVQLKICINLLKEELKGRKETV